MGRPATNITGQKFGLLTAVERADSTAEGRALWRCRCECGTELTVRGRDLRNASTRSCGCATKSFIGDAIRTHGNSHRPEFHVWTQMLDRCANPRNKKFADYGGRGIAVCERWQSFEAFIADMGERPFPAAELDRERNDEGYEPGNCRWVTHKVQMNNTRRSTIIEHDGLALTIAQWSERTGIAAWKISERRRRGLAPAEILCASSR